MHSTAGANVVSLNSHDSDIFCQLKLASIAEIFQRFFIGIFTGEFCIFVNSLVSSFFNINQLFSCKLAVKVYSHVVAEMKADILIAVKLMHDTGNNMLTRMVLHTPKTLFPVDFTAEFFSYI